MKQVFTIILLGLGLCSIAQNVGIGITTPAFRLDVRNGSINTDSLYRINSMQVLSVKGNGNLFAGENAGIHNTGDDNTFSGDSAGLSNTTGVRNSFFGYKAGVDNTSGQRNTALGARALFLNTGGSFNTATGHEALFSNSSGEANTAMGGSALSGNSTGSYNTGLGFSALSGNDIGMNNTAIGPYALRDNDGDNNVGVGYGALFSNATGDNNTAVGLSSQSNNLSGSGNTTLGYNAEVATGALANATAIGYNAMVSSSNSLVLGSINGVNTATGSTNVGIGISNPQAALHVVGPSSLSAQFAAPGNMYVALHEGNSYRGYIGSYAGDAEDVDFGTGSGNATGSVHLTLQAVPKLTVMSSGDIDIAGELNRSVKTGSSNLVPICYGNIASGGGINSGSGNFTVSKATTGWYVITITGEAYQFQQYSTVATAVGSASPIIANTGSGSGALHVHIFNAAGTATDNQFNFVVYKN